MSRYYETYRHSPLVTLLLNDTLNLGMFVTCICSACLVSWISRVVLLLSNQPRQHECN